MTKKLKNKQGVTILMALLLLLVATVISCVVLTAVMSAAKALQDDRAQQQAFLNVSSAAYLLRGQITQARVEVADTGDRALYGPQSIQAVLEGLVKGLYSQPSQGEASYRFSIRSAQTQIGTVDVTVSLDTQYTLTVLLENRDERYPCCMVLTAAAQAESISESGDDLQEKTGRRYLWPEDNISIAKGKGAAQ